MVDRPEYEPVEDDPWSRNALGVDVANSEQGDMACLAWGHGNELDQLHEFQYPNANHLAHNTFKTAEQLAEGKYQDYGTSKIQDYGLAADNKILNLP